MEKSNTSKLTGAKETLFITLYAKAKDSQEKHSILNDTRAFEILNSVDYDFEKFKKSKKDFTITRAKQFDEWVKEFIATHPNAVIVYLGCGLDSRVTRIHPPESVDWYDLDFSEVIEIRKRFYADNEHYKMIASSATDENWLAQIPNNRPTLIIAEGVLPYLATEEVMLLLQRLTDHFKEGEIAFEAISSFALNYMYDKGNVYHRWSIDDTSEIEKWNPKLKKMNEIPFFKLEYIKKLSFSHRVVYGIMAAIPKWRNMIHLLRYEF